MPFALNERLRVADGDPVPHDGGIGPADAAPMIDLIELFFFAYRDFVGDADRLLTPHGFGRAHHRVLHFVMRQPGLAVAELLDILRITKQSLNRVMKDLVDADCIAVQPGVADRRQRLLFATPKGRQLALDLAGVQSARFERVFGSLGHGAREAAQQFLLAVVDRDGRDAVRARLVPGTLPARLTVAAGRST